MSINIEIRSDDHSKKNSHSVLTWRLYPLMYIHSSNKLSSCHTKVEKYKVKIPNNWNTMTLNLYLGEISLSKLLHRDGEILFVQIFLEIFLEFKICLREYAIKN